MSIASILRSRSVLWHDVLDSFGYVASRSPPAAIAGELRIRAGRPRAYGGPAATVEVHELWGYGQDPDGLGTEQEGCYLVASSWHAQVTPNGDLGAERLDLDRSKRAGLVIHRHPFGTPNAVRIAAVPLIAPAQWLENLEQLIYDEFFAGP